MKSKSQISRFKSAGALCAVVLGWALGAQAQVTPITTQPIFSDDFSGGKLDSSQWTVYDSSYSHARAQFGNTPTTARDSDGTTYLKVPVQTYNPNSGQAGKTFLGTELFSRQNWDLGTGKEYEARLRMKDLPTGLCLGFFSYGFSGQWQDTYLQSEIDNEFLTLQGGSKIWMNIWDDWNPIRGGPRGDVSGFTPLQSFSGLNWQDGNWHDFKIRWYPDHTDWIVDDRFVHSENRIQPGSPMGVRFNNWVPDGNWGTGYDPSFVPASSASANQTYSMDVDFVRVRPIPAPSSGVWGNGSGLNATYYNNIDFTGSKVTRLDPRINFLWGDVGPVPSIDIDTWSARWTGFIQPQFSQSYTLTLRSDDGVRLYVNNTKVIDDWVNRGATDSTYTFNATAGQKIPITIEYFDTTGGASCQFYWSSASTPAQLVPQSQLYPSDVTPTPTPTTAPTPTPKPTQAPTPTPTPTLVPTPTPTPFFVAAPVFSPPAGTYSSTQQVAITSATSGAVIYYTNDGNDPTQASNSLPAGKKVTVSTSQLLRARAFVPGKGSSAISNASYTINSTDVTVPQITITTPRNGAKIKSFAGIKGTLVDNTGGSGPDHVDLQIQRVSDNAVWNGWVWENADTAIPTKIKATKWNVTAKASNGATLPTAAMLKNESFVIRAIGYDKAGNVATISISVTGPIPKVKNPKGKSLSSGGESEE